MKAMLFLKLLVVTAIFLLLVLIGLNNRTPVEFNLPLLADVVRQPAALMYFGFFAVGLLTGALLCIPSGKPRPKTGKLS